MRYGMVIDLDKCIGCQSCAVVCKMHNSQPPGTWWNRAFTQGASYHQTAIGSDGVYKMEYLPVSCQMCENPACEKVCPTGATYTNEDSVVLVDYDRCIGCRTCMAACPYGARQFNWKDPKEAKTKILDMNMDTPTMSQKIKIDWYIHSIARRASSKSALSVRSMYKRENCPPVFVHVPERQGFLGIWMMRIRRLAVLLEKSRFIDFWSKTGQSLRFITFPPADPVI